MKKLGVVLIMVATVVIASSCVSMKRFNELKADAIRLDSQNSIKAENIDRLNGEIESLNNTLASERSRYQRNLESAQNNFDQMKSRYERLLRAGSEEADKMLREIADNQARLQELEERLRNREEAINEIKRKVSDALLGFEGKGLTITQRNGMVYVSMDDKLLFNSGSFKIGTEGTKAVKELAEVLAQNPDINIMVEGHTDNVPYKENGQLKDNLDLSVKRATTVTRLLLQNKGIAPERIVSAGRGDALPLDSENSREARQKNRRTEIILTPKLDELLQLAQ
jgi:chemotaxis protein MotB